MLRTLGLLTYCLLLALPCASANGQRHGDPLWHSLARSYLNIPYRADGVTDIHGRYVTFADPAQELTGPGLNCSGFVVAFARKALGRPLPLATVSHDRQGNSGPGARLGEDWDFGRDLILNITEGMPREFLGPAGKLSDDGLPERGFSLHDKTLWRRLLPRLARDRVYFASVSKPWYGKKPYRLLHYHVGVIIKQSEHQVWLYHATRFSRVHRYNLASAQGMAQLDYQFPPSLFGDKHMLLVGVAPSQQRSASSKQHYSQ